MLRLVDPKAPVALKHMARCLVARRWASDALKPLDTYLRRHNGPSAADASEMLKAVGSDSMGSFLRSVIPEDVLVERPLKIQPEDGFAESEMLSRMRELARRNKMLRSYIGRGYYGTIMPPVVQRNVLENPQWYTSYTPYQPEISQGRLESLLNFQTLVTELTGMDIANASLLDEATAAAEAMMMSFVNSNRKKPLFYVDAGVLPQTVAVLHTRARGQGIEVRVGLPENQDYSGACGALVQYPAADGSVKDWTQTADAVHAAGGFFAVAADPLALTLLKEPAKFGADIALGSMQRFGVPMGFGGPHAAYYAVKDSVKRRMPGRLVGVARDRRGNRALRLALQTREQHIRRDKATSNICTAQALLANISAMYAVYHGPEGLRNIASRVYSLTTELAELIGEKYTILNATWFDTLTVDVGDADAFAAAAVKIGINVYRVDNRRISISLDETVSESDFANICSLFGVSAPATVNYAPSPAPARESAYLQQEVFNKYHSETEILRYMNWLQSKDISLATSMIPLGSCTMKLNATSTMVGITWPEFANIHPFVPRDQAEGYYELIRELEIDLADITGFAATTLQPNSGAQGEFTGLRIIKSYLESIGEGERNICLIPVSAHGTNPASAAMAGMKIVPIKCTPTGELDLLDLEAKVAKHSKEIAAVMITYPSTFGVFEPTFRRACQLVHEHGGQVYMDGANMNAQVGLTSPGDLGADVCHLNLHKTFCIPHGGGGPGVGPVCVAKHLVPFLPDNSRQDANFGESISPVAAAPYGSALVLSISWGYIKMMGGKGLKEATSLALLNANYMKERLAGYYPIAYLNANNRCAHEFILDLRPFKRVGVEAIDVAKRLQDFGFHAPTMSWPVAGTLMVEPTESESKEELDRFCDALIAIRAEIRDIEEGLVDYKSSVLAYAPHTIEDLIGEWDRGYSREYAAYPLSYLRSHKVWPAVARVDDAYGDTHLICTCEPLTSN